MDTLIIGLTLPAGAYLLGSIPFGLLFVHLVAGQDIRDFGSGNIGATNVKRLIGLRWAVTTLALDGAKGMLPAWGAVCLSAEGPSWLVAATLLAAVCGHMFPIYLNFKASGKGVATAAGAFLAAAPFACGAALLVFILTVRWSRSVSAGSLAATVVLPPAVWFVTHNPAIALSAIVVMVLILSRHKENIQRLASGREPPWTD
jgi:glycerol-3-phosphate acyltransferase PlsY